MKKSKKILITVAVILVAVGMICGFCGIYSLGFNFNEISTSDFVTHTYTVEDDFTNIIIEDAESNINFYKSMMINVGYCVMNGKKLLTLL